MSTETSRAERVDWSMSESAIGYLLVRIQSTPELAWHFIATESYARLIEAYAALTGRKAFEIEQEFRPRQSYCCRKCHEEEKRQQEASRQAERCLL